jgi:hypothetical protein
MTDTTPQPKWTSTAGPIQTKAVKTALGELATEHKQFIQLEGIVGGPERRHSYCSLFSTERRADVTAAETRIAEQFNYTITSGNYRQIVAAVTAALPTLKDNRPIKDERRSPDEERLRLEQVDLDNQQRQLEQQAHNAETDRIVEKLNLRYPWAKTRDDSTSRQARAAANLRKELAIAFPNTKFSVRSDSASMTNSVNYHWTLGPTAKAVAGIADKYEYGRFDGMQDLAFNDTSAFGEAVEQVLGRAKYVSGSREIPAEIHDQVGRLLCEAQQIEFQGNSTQHLFGQGDTRWLSDHVDKLLAQTTFPPNAEISGIVYSEGGQDEATKTFIESGYQLTFTTSQQFCPDPKHDTPCPLPCEACAADDCETPTPTSVTVTENRERQGIELRFPGKPPQNILDQLHHLANGTWRYHRKGRFWYAKASDNTREFAQRLAA